MSYHIEINEYQRRLIMKALTSTDVNQFSQAPGSGDAFDTEAKEFVCLVQMFGTLDLDESPMAYRRLPEVIAQHAGTVKVLHTLRPFAVAMAGTPELDPWKD